MAATSRASATLRATAAELKTAGRRSDQSGGNLARDAGVNDIGSSGQRADNNDSGSRQGFFDQASHDDDDDMDHDSDGFDGDSDGDGDYA